MTPAKLRVSMLQEGATPFYLIKIPVMRKNSLVLIIYYPEVKYAAISCKDPVGLGWKTSIMDISVSPIQTGERFVTVSETLRQGFLRSSGKPIMPMHS